MTIRRHDNAAACIDPLRRERFTLWAAMPNPDAVPVDRIPLTERMAFVFGNEGDGIAEATLRLCHGVFAVPMFGFSGSFNVSVAAGITFYVVTRRYRAWRATRGDLDAGAAESMVRDWLAREQPGVSFG
jgi:tRNA (guanosine-2'-O-)-methyltransferase